MSLFINSNILSINMLYVETVSSLMYDVSRLSVPSNISMISSLTFIKYMYAQDQELLVFGQLLY